MNVFGNGLRTVQLLVGGAAALLVLCGCVSGPVASPESLPSSVATTAPTLLSEQQRLDDLWNGLTGQYPDAVQPSVSLVRYTELDEWGTVQAACMADEGFPDVQALPDGSIQTLNLPPDQREAYQVATFVCYVKYPLDTKYTDSLDNDQLDVLYDYLVNDLVPCLENEGYSVSPASSRTEFIDSYTSGGWNPYAELNDSFKGNQNEPAANLAA